MSDGYLSANLPFVSAAASPEDVGRRCAVIHGYGHDARNVEIQGTPQCRLKFAEFLDRVTPPDNAKSLHAGRTLYVSLVCEALTDALAYLDTGDEALAKAAMDRRADALGARKALQRTGR